MTKSNGYLFFGCGYAAMNLHPLWFLISIRLLSQVSYHQHAPWARDRLPPDY
ncbi:MAG: hypothetical protein LBC02_09615 [Planctomycetaceae bacterium]|nr:hypothetical protein [Planctomycetaceae bacterium]